MVNNSWATQGGQSPGPQKQGNMVFFSRTTPQKGVNEGGRIKKE